jgi:hypothetical protein
MRRIRVAAAALLLTASGCGEGPMIPLSAGEPSALTSAGTDFLVCPSETARSTRGTIGVLGGTLALDGHSLDIPALALSEPTTFSLTAPASDHVEIEIHADGSDSFTFLLPVTITISYDRCERDDIDPASLTVWHIDSVTGTLLELMGGVADGETRAVTFSSGHLSGFIIAN